MRHAVVIQPPSGFTLGAETAVDLLTPKPLAVRADTAVRETAVALTGNGLSAALVTDAAGEPIGVVTCTDLVRYHCEQGEDEIGPPGHQQRAARGRGKTPGNRTGKAGRTPVRDIMTPAVFSVAPDTPASAVVQAMPALGA